MSGRIICRQWLRPIASSTLMPRAFASMSARSCIDTMSWSRSCGDSSLRPNSAITPTMSPTTPQMMYWSCQAPRWLTVLVETTATTRLPMTGPRVQKPIAEARPSCGEKSLTRAGVATRMTPSTRPMTTDRIANDHLSPALGIPKRASSAVSTKP